MNIHGTEMTLSMEWWRRCTRFWNHGIVRFSVGVGDTLGVVMILRFVEISINMYSEAFGFPQIRTKYLSTHLAHTSRGW